MVIFLYYNIIYNIQLYYLSTEFVKIKFNIMKTQHKNLTFCNYKNLYVQNNTHVIAIIENENVHLQNVHWI